MIKHHVTLDHDAPLAAGHRVRKLLPSGLQLGLHQPGSAQRAAVEQYIAGQFRSAHRAHINQFMPWLISMECADRLIAAVGVRPAKRQTLFLERYLSHPIESAIGKVAGSDVARREVAEIGNLVASQRGASQLLFLLLTAFVHQQSLGWVVFTATPVVRKVLLRLGFQLHFLCTADPASLSADERSAWGRYYDNRPVVVAGHVPAAMDRLAERRVHSGTLALFRDQLQSLGTDDHRGRTQHGTPSFAA